MRVRYIYSACVVIETEQARLLCDPWFTEGVYDGSWYHYPPIEQDPVELIGKVDAVYISHLHPDHYDTPFLRRYLERYPNTRILICDENSQYLKQLMALDGFKYEACGQVKVGDIDLHIYPNTIQDPGYDTALVAVSGNQCVVNLNDNPFDPTQLDNLLTHCPGGRPSLALLPYAGAGPYPQTYMFDNDDDRARAAEGKRRKFVEQFRRYREYLGARRVLPFAGKYILAGPLARLNELRGVPDPVDVANEFGDDILVLADGGQACLDLTTLEASAVRTEPYARSAIAAYLRKVDFPGYDYEREFAPRPGRKVPVQPLLVAAYRKAFERAAVERDFWFCITTSADKQFYCFNVGRDLGVEERDADAVQNLEPRHEIYIDERYLFGLLTRLYHWNNAEIGSQYTSRRVPDLFWREVYTFLHFLHV